VYYIGGEFLEHDTDSYAKRWMLKHLVLGSIYTISSHRMHMIDYCDHYYFKEREATSACYPCNCFIILDSYDEFIRTKYSLR
jgi:hypothetical protein